MKGTDRGQHWVPLSCSPFCFAVVHYWCEADILHSMATVLPLSPAALPPQYWHFVRATKWWDVPSDCVGSLLLLLLRVLHSIASPSALLWNLYALHLQVSVLYVLLLLRLASGVWLGVSSGQFYSRPTTIVDLLHYEGPDSYSECGFQKASKSSISHTEKAPHGYIIKMPKRSWQPHT